MRERIASVLLRAGALDAMLRLRRLAPRQHLSIVTYHHVTADDPGSPFDPAICDAAPAQFRRQLELVLRQCTPIGMDQLIGAVDGATLPKNPVMITFDDGYRSCHDVALPILRTLGVPATFFVSTAFVTERRLYWWERISLILARGRRRHASIDYPEALEIDRDDARLHARLLTLVKTTAGLDIERFLSTLTTALDLEWSPAIEAGHANDLIMSWDHVRALADAGMDVESHGRWHRVLQTLDDAALEDELAGSRADLEAELGRPVRAIAYPVGRRIEPRIRNAVAQAGYRIGLSNKTGVNRLNPLGRFGRFAGEALDPFDLRRLSTDRAMSDGMFLTQIALPRLAYMV